MCKLSDVGHGDSILTWEGLLPLVLCSGLMWAEGQGSEAAMWRWTSIEAMQMQGPSTMSDVWPFGVVLWEIFTLGATPYLGGRNRGACD